MSVTNPDMSIQLRLLYYRWQCKQREILRENQNHAGRKRWEHARGVLQGQSTHLAGSRPWALSLVPQGEREKRMILSGATLSRKIRQALATWRESRGQPGVHEIPCLSYCPMAVKRHHDQKQTNKPFNCGTGYNFQGLVHYHHDRKNCIRRAGMGLKDYILIYRHQR